MRRNADAVAIPRGEIHYRLILTNSEIAMSNIATLLPPIQKGERRGGRVVGSTNRVTRALKKAIINAAEKSEHCPEDNKSLEGYCTYLANEHPTTFAVMLTRLIPVQAKIKSDGEIPQRLSINMSLSDMVSAFEMKIKSDYRPTMPMLVQNDVEVEVIEQDDEAGDA